MERTKRPGQLRALLLIQLPKGVLDPIGRATRAEVAAMLMRFLESEK